MRSFKEIIIELKSFLAAGKTIKILDKDIALALDINPQNYAVIKRRQRVPYEAIAHFSKKNRLNMTWLLFAQKPKYLT